MGKSVAFFLHVHHAIMIKLKSKLKWILRNKLVLNVSYCMACGCLQEDKP